MKGYMRHNLTFFIQKKSLTFEHKRDIYNVWKVIVLFNIFQ